MAGPYADYTDADLLAEQVDYRAARKSAAMGGKIKSIAGEGRRKEFITADPAAIFVQLREIEAEIARRPTLNSCGPDGGSLEIEFRRDHGYGPFGGSY